jgi:hypothetical protein
MLHSWVQVLDGNVPLSLLVGKVEWSLWLLVSAAEIVMFGRLAQSGLWRTYRYFAVYLAAQVLEAAALMVARPGTEIYGWIYVAFVPILGFSAVLAVLEVYQLVLRGYPGIGTLGRRVLSWSLVAALCIAAATLYPDIANREEKYPILLYAHVFQRTLYSALLLFVLFITAFLVWFPVPLSRNVTLHAGVFGVSFVSASMIFLVRNAGGPEFREIVSIIHLAVYAACLLVWIVFLTPEGERKNVKVGHR